MLKQVFLGLGSNMGPKRQLLEAAVQEIQKIPTVFELRVSNYYRTKPVSDLPQDDFLNAVCVLKTKLKSKDFFEILEGIERSLGKVPKAKDEPRPIDIDLLLFGDEFSNDPDLTLPHPRMLERYFVLKPLSDLVDFLQVPDGKGSVYPFYPSKHLS